MIRSNIFFTAVIVAIALACLSSPVQGQRATDGLIALYEFNEGTGTEVNDSSNFGDPLTLFIDPGDLDDFYVWGDGFIEINRGLGGLKEEGGLAIESDGPATKIFDAIVNPDTGGTNELTIEAWLTPEFDGSPGLEHNGNPSRLLSMSFNPSFRNFTLGQNEPGDTWVSRIRNSETGRNGTCCGYGQLTSDFGAVEAEVLTHVVVTRTVEGTETLYYNKSGQPFGESVDREVPSTLIDGGNGDTAGGNPGATDWNPDYTVVIGNESDGPRSWAGIMHLAAIYNRALTADEVNLNFQAGPEGDTPTALQAGDADEDFDFDQLDLVKVQIAAKYLSNTAANWGEGDWDGAPGGEQGSPPAGNGFFDQLDIIAALASGNYLTGPYAANFSAIAKGGSQGDGQTSIVYTEESGELAVDAPAGRDLTSINITSAGGMFIGAKPAVLDGAFDNFAADNIFKATFGGSFGSISFGNVLAAGISEDALAADLSAVGSLNGGGDLGAVDLVYIPIPEPTSIVLLLFGLALFVSRRRM